MSVRCVRYPSGVSGWVRFLSGVHQVCQVFVTGVSGFCQLSQGVSGVGKVSVRCVKGVSGAHRYIRVGL